MNKKLFTVLFVTTLLLSSCLKNVNDDAQKIEIADRNEYLIRLKSYIQTLKGDTAYRRLDTTIYHVKDNTPYGFYYIRLDTGSAKVAQYPITTDYIYFHYTLSLINGQIVQTSDHLIAKQQGLYPVDALNIPVFFRIDTMSTPGLVEGIPLMKVGTKFRFIFPSELAGSTPNIPAFTTLIYDINLLQIVPVPFKSDSINLIHWLDSLKLIDTIGTSTKIYYKIDSVSSGDTLKKGNQVKIYYRGKLITGNICFNNDSTKDDSITFTLGQNQWMRGMDSTLLKLRDSCKAEVIIPYKLAFEYGIKNSKGQSLIPRDHSLYFQLNRIIRISK